MAGATANRLTTGPEGTPLTVILRDGIVCAEPGQGGPPGAAVGGGYQVEQALAVLDQWMEDAAKRAAISVACRSPGSWTRWQPG
jgi:hypothetical protein